MNIRWIPISNGKFDGPGDNYLFTFKHEARPYVFGSWEDGLKSGQFTHYIPVRSLLELFHGTAANRIEQLEARISELEKFLVL